MGQYLTVSGQRDAIERAFHEHADRLWRSILGFSGDPEVASDAVAEAFAQALAHDDDLRSPADWVWTSAFRIARGALKMEGRDTEIPRAAEGSYELPEPVRDLVKALAAITERQRLAIVLHDYADRPTSEVADVLGISTATVYVHLSQGRRRLRRLLAQGDEA